MHKVSNLRLLLVVGSPYDQLNTLREKTYVKSEIGPYPANYRGFD